MGKRYNLDCHIAEMENRKASETLEGGFGGSKFGQIENPCGKILEAAEFNNVCNLLGKSSSDVNSGSRLSLARDVVNGNVEESLLHNAGNGNDRMNKGSLDFDHEGSLCVEGDESRNEDMPFMHEGLNFSGEDEIWAVEVETAVENSNGVLQSHAPVGVENVQEYMEKVDGLFQCEEPASPRKVEVSGNGIDIFVEMFGPLDGLYDSDNNVSNSGEQSERDIAPDQENEKLSPNVESVTVQNVGGDNVGENECEFGVGDLVWVKTQTQLWWPAVISDYRNSSEDERKAIQKDSFLVKYIGNGNEMWSSSPNLKPFLEHYEEMSGQNNSRSFRGSMEKALSEVGWRVKSEMTCPCFSDKSSNLSSEIKECKSLSGVRISKSDRFSLSRFEPANFVACIRKLACSVSSPGKVDMIFLKNRLSAYYQSTGHLQLPMQLLRPCSEAAQNGSTSKILAEGRNGNLTIWRRRKRKNSDDTDKNLDGKKSSSGIGSELRERKKSKYLSYPFVNVKKGSNAASTSGQETENTSGKNSQKKGSQKPTKEQHTLSKADDINACSAELLAELRSCALDCSYLRRSKYSDSLKRFYSSFRIFAFLDSGTADKHAGVQEVSNDDKSNLQDSLKAEMQVHSLNVSEDHEKENVNNAPSTKSSKKENQDGKGKVIRKRRTRKKKEEVISSNVVKPTSNSFGLASHIKSCVISFQAESHMVPGIPQIETVAKPDTNEKGPNFSYEQMQVKAPSVHQVTESQSIPVQVDRVTKPESNGNGLHLSFEQMQARGPFLHQVEPLPQKTSESFMPTSINGVEELKAFSHVPSFTDLHNVPQQNNGVRVKYTNQLWTAEYPSGGEPKSNVMNTGPSPSVLQTGLLSFSGQPKQRKRRRKTSEGAPVLPDLNGNALDGSSPGITSTEGPPQVKRRRRNKATDTELGPDGKIICRIVNNKQDPGGSLLLTFAPESPLPSKETFAATFSRFGLLKESEIQVLDDSTAQIVYERSSDAGFAFRSLEKSNPFGASLASFKLEGVSASTAVKKKNKLLASNPFCPVDACKNPTKPGEAPDLAMLRQNMEMMKDMLEKAGDSLSPEMRAKLENEIKGFLDKINFMTSSSPPPSSNFQL